MADLITTKINPGDIITNADLGNFAKTLDIIYTGGTNADIIFYKGYYSSPTSVAGEQQRMSYPYIALGKNIIPCVILVSGSFGMDRTLSYTTQQLGIWLVPGLPAVNSVYNEPAGGDSYLKNYVITNTPDAYCTGLMNQHLTFIKVVDEPQKAYYNYITFTFVMGTLNAGRSINNKFIANFTVMVFGSKTNYYVA